MFEYYSIGLWTSRIGIVFFGYLNKYQGKIQISLEMYGI